MMDLLKINRKLNQIIKLLDCQNNSIVSGDGPPINPPINGVPVLGVDISSGDVYYWDGDSWELISSGGGGSSYVEMTYAEAEPAKASNELIPGALYKITDRGDRGIFLTAISVNEFDIEGLRLMLIPQTYLETGLPEFGSGNWLGIWRASLTPNIGDLVIWGGQVWSNVNGNVGNYNSEVELDSEWVLIPKTSYSDFEYREKMFGCHYLFDEDRITYQWDNAGNILGDYRVTTPNVVDISDWGMVDAVGFSVFGNQCRGIYNNYSTQIWENKLIGGYNINNNIVDDISENSNNGTIAYNTCSSIQYNKNGDDIVYNVLGLTGKIYLNSNLGNIDSNICLNGDISLNSNLGEIAENQCDSIEYNSNSGHIADNQVESILHNSNKGAITNNTTGENITYNSNDGDISSNTSGLIMFNKNIGNISGNITDDGILSNYNAGDIDNNTLTSGSIQNNGNVGDINDNNLSGAIQNNHNNGNISSNGGFDDIYNNNNNGAIHSNAISGNISNNSNNGEIYGCGHTGSILNNRNNGLINGCTGFGNDVKNNINNGSIISADVTGGHIEDVIVNK